VSQDSLWITGSTRSGKTQRLIEQFLNWAKDRQATEALFFAATGDNRLDLVDRITSVASPHRFDTATPIGFFQDEVTLFFPLIVQQLGLKDQFPLRLRPETEQELATELWRSLLSKGDLQQAGISDYFMVRRTLDLLQLAAASGTPLEDITPILKAGLSEQEGTPELWAAIGTALEQWRTWLLDRGLLTYGVMTELYWRYLLPHPVYQQQLKQRYWAVLVDDADEYPAIARSLFEVFLEQDIPIAFTYNPNGAIRSGLGADPTYLQGLAQRCQTVETLSQSPTDSLGATWGETIATWMNAHLPELPDSIRSIQTPSRAQLLRQIAETIADNIYSGQVQPQDIAVIAPGLDAIARYTLREILTSKGIPVNSLHDQHPLASSSLVRSLLTLLALIYPGLGQLLNRDAIAEMLVILSQLPDPEGAGRPIDLVRAGLLTDYCFVPDLAHPHLRPATSFDRWDRLGFQAAHAYGEILQWVEIQKEQQQQRLIPNPVVLLDRAIQRFLYGGSHLPYDQIALLRELMETAQHYWEIVNRLRQSGDLEVPMADTVQNFIQLLRNGTITADPYPVRPIGKASQAVTLATIYQYRGDRRYHRHQFWLDAGSPLWLSGGGGLYGAPLFWCDRPGRPWTVADTLETSEQRLQRQVLDLLCRTGDRVYLCHSDLATNGQEQAGSLLSLINAAVPQAVEI
jgi:hypothetical protein